MCMLLYAGRVKVAKFLIKKGASAEAANEVFWDSQPPLLLAAAKHGTCKAGRCLVEERGVPISVKWNGHDITNHIKCNPGWDEEHHFQDQLTFAKLKGAN